MLLPVALLPGAAPARPNFVFLFSDDATWQAIRAYNPDLPVPTPNLDRLAAAGMRFDRCTVGNSICSPSRATLLTGTHSHRHRVVDNYTPFDDRQLTYPKLLQAVGYQTALIGKWHLHTLPTGFDHFDILDGQGNYYNSAFIRSDTRRAARVPGHTDVVIGDKAVEWLRTGRDPARPFSLNVHFKVPHRPFLPPAAQLEAVRGVKFPEPASLFSNYAGRATQIVEAKMRLNRDFTLTDMKVRLSDVPDEGDRAAWAAFREKVAAEHAALPVSGPERERWIFQRYMEDYVRCMLALDREVGRVLATLDELGLADNTVVLFAGDQGFFLGENGWFDKRLMYEPSFRTPFLVRAPGVTRAGTNTAALAQNIDWAPTILDLAGIPVPAEMHGRSLVPLLRGERPADWRTSLYYHYYEGPEGDHSAPRHEGVTTERHKLISFYESGAGGEWEFYDLATDPAEQRNRIDDPAVATVVAELKAELQRLRARYEVPANDTIARTVKRPLRTQGAIYEHAK
jgi:arylsulfatase A-like enzyme